MRVDIVALACGTQATAAYDFSPGGVRDSGLDPILKILLGAARRFKADGRLTCGIGPEGLAFYLLPLDPPVIPTRRRHVVIKPGEIMRRLPVRIKGALVHDHLSSCIGHGAAKEVTRLYVQPNFLANTKSLLFPRLLIRCH